MLNTVLRSVSSSAFMIAIVAAAGLCGCSARVDQRGNLPEQDKLAEIHAGSTTQDQVRKILGTPSSTGIFDNASWYYISKKTEQVAFLDPDTTDQQVYVINFDGRGVVRSVDHKTLQDGRDIVSAPGATPAPGRELTFVEQVLGNIGRFGGSGGSKGSGPADGGTRQGPNPYDPNH
ncbi:MAG: outer membrane protein assembly factor BamE [Alphaproteobacteria bacterium]|nr:outer membrane protein assembly factor BamE [Alphaproteobacteria bacterium]